MASCPHPGVGGQSLSGGGQIWRCANLWPVPGPPCMFPCSPPLPLFPSVPHGSSILEPMQAQAETSGGPHTPPDLTPLEGAVVAAAFPLHGDRDVTGGTNQARPKQPWAGKPPPATPCAHCRSPNQPPGPPGPPGSGRRSRAATPGAPAFAGLEDRGVFATRRGTRINPRAYFIIEPTNFVSQRLRSLPRACAAQLRPTPPLSFISCQQENKEIINRKLICRGGEGTAAGHTQCLVPAGGDGGGAAGRQAIATRPPRAGQPGAMGAVGKPPSREGLGGYSNLYLITLK